MKKIILTIALSLGYSLASFGAAYPYKANPKIVPFIASSFKIVGAELKKVPATYELQEPMNCDRSENNCRLEQVVTSKAEVLQVTIGYSIGRIDDSGRPEDDIMDINFDKKSLPAEVVAAFSVKGNSARQNAIKKYLQLDVVDTQVNVQEPNCRLVNENWACEGSHPSKATITTVGVSLK